MTDIFRPRRAVAAVLALISLLAVAIPMVGASATQPESGLDGLSAVTVVGGSIGTGASEWSGATYNPTRNVVVTVDDESSAYVFGLDASGSVSDATPSGQFALDLDAGDHEGIAWVGGDRYLLLSEETGQAYEVEIVGWGGTVHQSDVLAVWPAGGPDGNYGSEGIAVEPDGSYVVIDEHPPALAHYDSNRRHTRTVSLGGVGLNDASGVAVVEGTYLVVSDESRLLVHLDIDWSTGRVTELDRMSMGGFGKLEGIAVAGGDSLHLFGEDTRATTYAHYVGPLVVAPQFETGDVNCSQSTDIIDAMLIAQAEVGIVDLDTACGSGDVDSDGITDIGDALLIAFCSVHIPNVACPDAGQ